MCVCVNLHVNAKVIASSLSLNHPIPFLLCLSGTMLRAPLVSASPSCSPIECQVQPPPAACRKARLQVPSFTFYDVHGVSEWQTIPGQWPWKTDTGALVSAGYKQVYRSELVSLSL